VKGELDHSEQHYKGRCCSRKGASRSSSKGQDQEEVCVPSALVHETAGIWKITLSTFYNFPKVLICLRFSSFYHFPKVFICLQNNKINNHHKAVVPCVVQLCYIWVKNCVLAHPNLLPDFLHLCPFLSILHSLPIPVFMSVS
jgi:hypothetical protein